MRYYLVVAVGFEGETLKIFHTALADTNEFEAQRLVMETLREVYPLITFLPNPKVLSSAEPIVLDASKVFNGIAVLSEAQTNILRRG